MVGKVFEYHFLRDRQWDDVYLVVAEYEAGPRWLLASLLTGQTHLSDSPIDEIADNMLPGHSSEEWIEWTWLA